MSQLPPTPFRRGQPQPGSAFYNAVRDAIIEIAQGEQANGEMGREGGIGAPASLFEPEGGAGPFLAQITDCNTSGALPLHAWQKVQQQNNTGTASVGSTAVYFLDPGGSTDGSTDTASIGSVGTYPAFEINGGSVSGASGTIVELRACRFGKAFWFSMPANTTSGSVNYWELGTAGLGGTVVDALYPNPTTSADATAVGVLSSSTSGGVVYSGLMTIGIGQPTSVSPYVGQLNFGSTASPGNSGSLVITLVDNSGQSTIEAGAQTLIFDQTNNMLDLTGNGSTAYGCDGSKGLFLPGPTGSWITINGFNGNVGQYSTQNLYFSGGLLTFYQNFVSNPAATPQELFGRLSAAIGGT